MMVQKARAQALSRDRDLKLLGAFVFAVAGILLTVFMAAPAHAKPTPKSYPKPIARKPSSASKLAAKKSPAKVRKTAKKAGPTASELAVKKIESESAVLWDTSYSRPQIVDVPTTRRPASTQSAPRTVSIEFSQADLRTPTRETPQIATPSKDIKTDPQSVVYIDK